MAIGRIPRSSYPAVHGTTSSPAARCGAAQCAWPSSWHAFRSAYWCERRLFHDCIPRLGPARGAGRDPDRRRAQRALIAREQPSDIVLMSDPMIEVNARGAILPADEEGLREIHERLRAMAGLAEDCVTVSLPRPPVRGGALPGSALPAHRHRPPALAACPAYLWLPGCLGSAPIVASVGAPGEQKERVHGGHSAG